MALKNLNNVEALEIFKNNNGLRCKVYADAIENEAYYGAAEVFTYFDNYDHANGRSYSTLKDYEIDEWTARVEANKNMLPQFINDCIDAQKALCVFDEKLAKKLQRVAAKIDFYDDACIGYEDISEARFYNLEKWIDETVAQLEKAVATYAQGFYTQFEDDDLLNDYFITFWLDQYGDGLQVDETGAVYETITTTKIYK